MFDNIWKYTQNTKLHPSQQVRPKSTWVNTHSKEITQNSEPHTWRNMALTKRTAQNQAMRTVVTCPYCKKRMQARHLAYKHVCEKQLTTDDLQQVSLCKLDKLLGKAVRRLSPESSPSSNSPSRMQQSIWWALQEDCWHACHFHRIFYKGLQH